MLLVYVVDDDNEREKVTYHIVWRKRNRMMERGRGDDLFLSFGDGK